MHRLSLRSTHTTKMNDRSLTRPAYRNVLPVAATGLLILLFVYAALSKLLDLPLFRGQLYNQSFSHRLADVLVFGLPASELLTSGLLMFQRTRRYGLWLSALLMTVFTIYITLVLLQFWSRVPCSCGGVLAHLSWAQHLIFNLFFLALSVMALWLDPPQRR
jgi:putative oxidoreductase